MTDDRRESLTRLALYFAHAVDAAVARGGFNFEDTREARQSLDTVRGIIRVHAPADWLPVFDQEFLAGCTTVTTFEKTVRPEPEDIWSEGLGDA